jgi:hypothetical protein
MTPIGFSRERLERGALRSPNSWPMPESLRDSTNRRGGEMKSARPVDTHGAGLPPKMNQSLGACFEVEESGSAHKIAKAIMVHGGSRAYRRFHAAGPEFRPRSFI